MSADPHERVYDTLIAEGDDGPMIEAVLDWLAQLVPRLAELRAQMEEEPLTAAEEAAIDVALRGVFASLRPMRKGA